MARRPIRPLFLLSAAALAPITLGIGMHLEHVAAAQACTADLAAWTATPSAPTATPVVPQVLPIPMPMVEPASEHALPFAFVIELAGPHVVLATDVDDSWAHGKPRALASNSPESGPSVTRDVALDRLPIAVRASVGRTMRLYASDGELCTARVGAPLLVAEISGDLDWGEDPDVASTRNDLEQTWEEGRRTLVAPLEIQGDCGTPLWARDVALPAPIVFTAVDGPVPRSARKAIMADPEVRDLAVEFRNSFEEPNADEPPRAIPSLAQRTVGQRWQDPRGHEVFTLAFSGEEFGGCGGFDMAWAAFVPSDHEGVTALDRAGDDVIAIVDLERDGKVEVITASWLGPTRLVEIGGPNAKGDALTERASLDGVPFFGCPC